jgi:hypothetical protein
MNGVETVKPVKQMAILIALPFFELPSVFTMKGSSMSS